MATKPTKCCFVDCTNPAVETKQYRDANGRLYAVRHYCKEHSGHA